MVAPVETVEETAGYAEYVRWCGRTGAARPPPTRLTHLREAAGWGPARTATLVITIAPIPDDIPEYDRSDWRHWIDEDGDCQDIRQEVLVAESLDKVTFETDEKCRVETGRWYGAFDGHDLGNAGHVDVDHMVPLRNAHLSGAWVWSSEKKETAEAALTLTRDITGLRHDLLGRIFHTVLDTARYDGSFYTSTSAATMLATLAINEETCDFNDPEAISRLRITDPACGTGTLLMTAGERVRELIGEPGLTPDTNKTIIEQVLRGYDVNLTATHMAATTLGLLSPTTSFKNMKIGRALLGVDKRGNTYLGSLLVKEKKLS